jgi:DUF1680 family protein
MNMLSGDAKYIDILERSLYNAALDGLSLSGDRFFYGNPLASDRNHSRSEWFGTACCPSNIARLVASLGNYIYSYNKNAVWINLFIGSDVRIPIDKHQLALSMQTGYPWKGNTTIVIREAPSTSVQLRIRIPGWLSEPVDGGLYRYLNSFQDSVQLLINGDNIPFTKEHGYAVVNRKWKKGDSISFVTPMRVRKVVSHEKLLHNKDRIALQYGPLVYCVEGIDNANKAYNFIVPDNTSFTVNYQPSLLGGVNQILFNARKLQTGADGRTVHLTNQTMKAIPYFSWNNRGPDEMQVWLPVKINDLKISP